MKLPAIPTLSQTESLLVFGVLGVVGYLAWKAKQQGEELLDYGVRAANRIGQTVRNTADNIGSGARQGVEQVWRSNPLTAPTAAAIDWYNNRNAAEGTAADPSYWLNEYGASVPDDFTDSYKRMQKPDYENLSQPMSEYPK